MQLIILNGELLSFTDICGACERIKNTPIPFSYSTFLKKFIFFFVLTLPFSFVLSLNYWAIPVVVFIFYALTSLEVIAEEMYHFYDAEYMMGFKLTDTGLRMILDETVPETISEHFPKIVHPFLEKNNLSIEEINHLIFHPGGRKIVQTVEELFGSLGKNIDDTREVLKQYGNMSSVTVLYVLERFLERNLPAGDKGLMLSFGPGFSAQSILLQW